MFKNVGEKIKSFAQVYMVFGWFSCFIVAIILWSSENAGIGFAVLIGGCLGVWISALFLYGFGELIVQTTNIAKGNQRLQILKAFQNEDIKEEVIKEIQDERIKEVEMDEEWDVAEKDECPCCFHKISENDEECRYCGHKLK